MTGMMRGFGHILCTIIVYKVKCTSTKQNKNNIDIHFSAGVDGTCLDEILIESDIVFERE